MGRTLNCTCLFWILGCIQLIFLVQGYPDQQPCGGSPSWVRGAPFGQMRVANYSTSTTSCVLTFSPNATTYTAGQNFTVILTSTSTWAYKVVTLGGASLVPGSGGSLVGTDCANFNSKRHFATLTLTAPTQGAEIRVKAICGTEGNAMAVATDIVLQAGANVSPPSVAATSSDPAYQYQTALTSGLTLFFLKNSTHLNFKITNNAVGYIGFGIGTQMLQSVVLVGMDPTVNSGYNALGIYLLNSKTGTVGQLLASLSALAIFGVYGAAYSTTTTSSTLQFSLLLAGQNSRFTFINGDGTDVSVSFSAGGVTYALHSKQGIISGANFVTGIVGNSAGDGPGTGRSPPGPGSTSGTMSTDPNYDFQNALGGQAIIFSRLNKTHGSFKLTMSANGYISFGVGSLMIGSSVITGMSTTANPGNPDVGLYKLNTKTGANTDVSTLLAGDASSLATYGIADTYFLSANGATEMRFSIELAEQKPTFTMFTSTGGSINVIWAVGPLTYGLHSSYGTLSGVNFASGAVGGFSLAPILAAHIICMIIAWELFIPVGVIIPLWNNAKHGMPGLCRISAPNWFRYHWVLQVLGVFCSCIGIVTGYVFVESTQSLHFSDFHKGLGGIIFGGSIIQPLWGHYRPSKIRNSKVSLLMLRRRRKCFEIGHPVFGYFLVLGGFINCLTGISEFGNVSGGQTYILGSIQGNSGPSGGLGATIIIFAAFFGLLILGGVYRSLHHRLTKTNPAAKPLTDSLVAQDDQKTLTADDMKGVSCWIIINHLVFDVSNFLSSHPGGKKVIAQYAGKNATRAFNEVGHSDAAVAQLPKFFVGRWEPRAENGNPIFSAESLSIRKPATENHQASSRNLLGGSNQTRKTVKLKEKTKVAHNVFMLTFALPSSSMVLGLPIGKHVSVFAPAPTAKVKGQWNNAPDSECGKPEIQRKYTPISLDATDIGTFTLMVKCYRPSSKYPDGGKMSRFWDNLKVEDAVQIAGPFGSHQYLGNGRFVESGHEINVKYIGMIAGGSGITPILQIAQSILLDAKDPCRISILYANSTQDDILLPSKLEDLERQYSGRFQIWYTLSEMPKDNNWNYSTGRITVDMFKEHLPPASPQTLIVSCGPKPMMDTAATLLSQLGYSDDLRYDY